MLALIVRRGVVAASLLALFWFGVTPPTDPLDALKVGSVMLAVGAVVGLLLTWPRKVWIRVLVFALAAFAIGATAIRSPDRPSGSILTGVITVLPFFVLLAIILGVDTVVALVLRKFTRTSEGSKT